MVATDLFMFQDKMYILTIDLFSHFPVVRQLCGESTKLILDALKDIFSDFGIPESIISDNGPCYKSQEFNTFHAKFKISHITGALYNHQANSIAEYMIQTIKQLMVKNQSDSWLALLILKSTPITNIPMIQHASDLSYKARLHNEDSTNYQTGSKDLVPLNLGSRVLYNKNPDRSSKRPEWSKGIIKDIEEPGRKYTITKDNGQDSILGQMAHM